MLLLLNLDSVLNQWLPKDQFEKYLTQTKGVNVEWHYDCHVLFTHYYLMVSNYYECNLFVTGSVNHYLQEHLSIILFAYHYNQYDFVNGVIWLEI